MDFTTIRVALTIAVQKNFVIHQMDVKTAFLHGDIDEIVYVIPPDGSGIELQSGQALKLKKGLYGRKQAPSLWYEKWSSVMKAIGFKALPADNYLFRYGKVWVLLYVDDVIIMGPERTEVESVKRHISGKLDMKDLGPLDQFLGIKFIRTEKEAWLLQE